jgi:hypothetical protein
MACLSIVPVYGTAEPVTGGELGDSGPDGDPGCTMVHPDGKGVNPFPILPYCAVGRERIGPRIAQFASDDQPRGTVDRYYA